MKTRILVIDDDPQVRQALGMVLRHDGYQFLEASSGPEGIQKAEAEDPDVIMLDIKMPHMDGMEVLEELRRRKIRAPILMISGHADVPTAVEATKKGAEDVLEKPLNSDMLLHRLRVATEHQKVRGEVDRLRREEEERYMMVGDSALMEHLHEDIEKAAPTNATVLITGESGTGKELVARAIHGHSTRAHRPFIKVNCAAIPEDLIESELFGHEKGSFTGATGKQVGKFVQADDGTIFLDEIGDMSPRTQAKVLRVLQEGEVEPVGAARVATVDVRVLAATNKDLATEIQKGRFREDLLFRLNVLPLHCPPLRDRTGDLPVLVDHFVRRFCAEHNLRPKTVCPEALEALERHPWPGNVRELQNIVERMLILTSGEVIRQVPLEPVTVGSDLPTPERYGSLKDFKEASERDFLIRKLDKNGWNISKTAKEIDTPRSNLYKKMEQYGLSKERAGAGPSSPGKG
jgi:two-component system, NtrC family, nitrogen regulation response regulator NtrX